MRRTLLAVAGLLLWTTFGHQSVRAQEEGEASQAWHHGTRISGGLQVRTWEARFGQTRLAAPPVRGMRQLDIGHRGLYSGEGDIYYMDGSIHPAPTYFDGVAHFTLQNQGQIGPAPHLEAFQGTGRRATFNSMHYERPRTSHDALNSAGQSEETVIVPFVLLECPLISAEEGWSLYGAARYAFGRGTIDRGPRSFSRTTHKQRVVQNQYAYDVLRLDGGGYYRAF